MPRSAAGPAAPPPSLQPGRDALAPAAHGLRAARGALRDAVLARADRPRAAQPALGELAREAVAGRAAPPGFLIDPLCRRAQTAGYVASFCHDDVTGELS